MVKYNLFNHLYRPYRAVCYVENSVRKFVIRDAPFWYILRPAVN